MVCGSLGTIKELLLRQLVHAARIQVQSLFRCSVLGHAISMIGQCTRTPTEAAMKHNPFAWPGDLSKAVQHVSCQQKVDTDNFGVLILALAVQILVHAKSEQL